MSESLAFGHFRVAMNPDGTPVELGRGAMGVTYKAYDEHLRIDVALKIITPTQVDNPRAQSLFLREARAAARVRQSNVASVLFLNEEPGRFFYAMEFVDGQSLKEWMVGRTPVAPVLAISITTQIARGLEAIHEQGIVHRDLKPANIMLVRAQGSSVDHSVGESEAEAWKVKIIDFGVARAPLASGADDVTATQTTGFRGTALYASPEQCEEKIELDGRSDLYSLGCILWEMLCGSPPFKARTQRELINQHVSDAPPVDGLLHLPSSLAAVVARLLMKDPDDRLANAAAVIKALERSREQIESGAESAEESAPYDLATAGATVAPPPTTRVGPATCDAGKGDQVEPNAKAPRRWPMPLAGAAILIALIGGIGNYAGWFRSSPGAAAGSAQTEAPIVAILPFDTADSGKESSDLADGLTAEVINRVSQVPSLRVISRGAVMAYKSAPGGPARKRVRDIGVELGGIRAVLESSIQRAGDTIKIDTILYDAETERRLWGATYNREQKDIFAIQVEIAEQIALALRARMTVAQRERLARPSTDIPKAYDLYRKAATYDGSNPEIKPLLEQAIVLDPNFGEAYADLAYWNYWEFRNNHRFDLEGIVVLNQGEALARKAIQIDPENTEAFAALARILIAKGPNHETGSLIARALQVAPHDIEVNRVASLVSASEGRFDEAYSFARRASVLDPKNPFGMTEVYRITKDLGLIELNDQWTNRMLKLVTDPSARELFVCRQLMLRGDFAGALSRLLLLPEDIGRMEIFSSDELILCCLLGAADWEAVVAFCERKSAKHPNLIVFAKYRAAALLRLGRIDESRQEATRILKTQEDLLGKSKDNEGAWLVRSSYLSSAVALEILGRQDEAVAHLDKFFQSGSAYPELFANFDPLPRWIFKDNPAAQERLNQLKIRYEQMAKRVVEIEKSYSNPELPGKQ